MGDLEWITIEQAIELYLVESEALIAAISAEEIMYKKVATDSGGFIYFLARYDVAKKFPERHPVKKTTSDHFTTAAGFVLAGAAGAAIDDAYDAALNYTRSRVRRGRALEAETSFKEEVYRFISSVGVEEIARIGGFHQYFVMAPLDWGFFIRKYYDKEENNYPDFYSKSRCLLKVISAFEKTGFHDYDLLEDWEIWLIQEFVEHVFYRFRAYSDRGLAYRQSPRMDMHYLIKSYARAGLRESEVLDLILSPNKHFGSYNYLDASLAFSRLDYYSRLARVFVSPEIAPHLDYLEGAGLDKDSIYKYLNG